MDSDEKRYVLCSAKSWKEVGMVGRESEVSARVSPDGKEVLFKMPRAYAYVDIFADEKKFKHLTAEQARKEANSWRTPESTKEAST